MRREHESELHKVESIVTEVSGLGDAYVYVCHVWMEARGRMSARAPIGWCHMIVRSIG